MGARTEDNYLKGRTRIELNVAHLRLSMQVESRLLTVPRINMSFLNMAGLKRGSLGDKSFRARSDAQRAKDLASHS